MLKDKQTDNASISQVSMNKHEMACIALIEVVTTLRNMLIDSGYEPNDIIESLADVFDPTTGFFAVLVQLIQEPPIIGCEHSANHVS